MPIQLTVLANRIYRRLNENANTDLPTLQSGTNTTPTLDAITGIIDGYNNALAELCRTCLPIPASGSITVSSGAAVISLSSATGLTSGVSVLWCANEAQFGGTALIPVGALQMSNWINSSGGIYQSATGTPAYFSDFGDPLQLAINPRPTTGATLTVGGFGIPTVATAGSDNTSSFLPDDLLEILEFRICSMLAKKGLDDPTLASRIPVWDSLYNERRVQLWSRIDRRTRDWRYPIPPGQIAEPQ